MNKIKLMYDTVTKVREKKAVSGELQLVGIRDEKQVLDFQNHFEKDWQTGLMKARICAEWNNSGHKLKHESINISGNGDRFHRIQGPMYAHHPCCTDSGGFRRLLNRPG